MALYISHSFLTNSPADDEGTLTTEVGVVCDSKEKQRKKHLQFEYMYMGRDLPLNHFK